MNGYIFIPLILVFILLVLSAKLPLSSFRREHRATFRAILVAVIPASIFFLVQTYLLSVDETFHPDYVYTFLGLEACWTILLIALLLIILLPAVSLLL